MSGVNAPFGSSEQNDGVVDTVSMRGPENRNNPIYESDFFNTAALASNRGVYWHFGVTEGIDHADEVGVFTDAATVSILVYFNDQGSGWALIGANLSTHRFCRNIGFLETLCYFFSDPPVTEVASYDTSLTTVLCPLAAAICNGVHP